jgi:hypothetical protein
VGLNTPTYKTKLKKTKVSDGRVTQYKEKTNENYNDKKANRSIQEGNS